MRIAKILIFELIHQLSPLRPERSTLYLSVKLTGFLATSALPQTLSLLGYLSEYNTL